MRIRKLHIDSFKNLQGFDIEFDGDSFASVLVGRNGSGKSNLLEALILIFRDLDLGEPPAFGYKISYTCRGRHIEIDADLSRRQVDRVRILVDDRPVSYRTFRETGGRGYLPNFVFGYYSGPSNRMEAHFERHQAKFYNELIKGIESPLRPLFYARLIHSHFVLLSFFTADDPDVEQFLKEHLRIESLDSVTFVLQQPPWKSSKGDQRFWNARGSVRSFLDGLYRMALAPLRIKQRTKVDFRQTTNLEHLYLYLPSSESLKLLSAKYPSQQAFFKALESTYISKLVQEVRIRVKVRGVDGNLTFRELSEGEQQLLMVLGLLRFTREDESLFLLDEPDTHLNPTWSLRYLDFMTQVVGKSDNSQIVMTTHDPLTIAALSRSQVQLISRDDETGVVSARIPVEDPKGMGFAGLLTSDIFGLRSQLDLKTLQQLDRKRELATKTELSDSEITELRTLNSALESVDITPSVRDPLFADFVKGMTRAEIQEDLREVSLTKDQMQRRGDLIDEVIRQVKLEQGIDNEDDQNI